MRMKRTVALMSTALVASMLLVTGCGRTAVNQVGSDETPSAADPADPGYEDPGYEDPGYEDPFYPLPEPGADVPAEEPAAPGGGADPAPAPAPAAPTSGLRPLTRPTPPPAAKPAAPEGGANPEEVRDAFMDLLYRFGYPDSVSAFDVRMQLLPLTRVNAVRWYPDDPAKPQRGLHYGRRKQDFPGPISFQQWQDEALQLARQKDAVTFYVARGPLYREIISDWYSKPQPRELVFYKRLNKSQLMVSYRPDGTVMDFGYFPNIDRRTFLEVPAAIWK